MEICQQKKPPSQQEAYCYHCGQMQQRKHLKRHTDRFHPFLDPKETTKDKAVQLDAERRKKLKEERETHLERQKQAKAVERKRKRIEVKLTEASKKQQQQQEYTKKVNDLTERNKAQIFVTNSKRTLRDTTRVNTEKQINVNAEIPVTLDAETHAFPTDGEPRGRRATCSYNTDNSVNENIWPTTQVTDNDSNYQAILPDSSVFSKKLKGARSVDAVLKEAKSFKKDCENNQIVCVPCFKNFGRGVISYNFMAGEDFSDADLHENFSELKKRVKEHIYKTSMHKMSATKDEGKFKNDEADIQAGFIVGRSAYKTIKQNLGQESFEAEIQNAEANGLDVGDINHSTSLCRNLTPIFFKNIKQRVKEETDKLHDSTGLPPCISAVVDKASPNHDTLHIVAIIVPYGDSKHAVFLEAIENKDGTGAGLATEIHTVLNKYFSDEELRLRLVGGSYDGQYEKNNVEKHLKRSLGLPDDDKFLNFTWDAAHALELAGKQSRGQKSDNKITVDFIANTFQTIDSLGIEKYGYGKSLRRLKEVHEERIVTALNDPSDGSENQFDKLKRFKSFSTTRFTAYTKNALKAFIDNYADVYHHLNEETSPELNKINNASFVLRMNGLHDVYQEVGKLSQIMQKPDAFTWTIDEAVDKTLEQFEKVQTSLMNNNPKEVVGLPNFTQAINELSCNGTYKNMPILNDYQAALPSRTRAGCSRHSRKNSSYEDKIQATMSELESYIGDLKLAIHEKVIKKRPEILKWSRDVFSTTSMTTLNFCDRNDSLKNLIQASRNLKPENKRENLHIQEEYKLFCNEVVEKTNSMHDANQHQNKTTLDHAIYMDLLNRKNSYPNMSILLSESCARTYCEAVTEGFGSVISNVVKGRENLSVERLSQETFIRLNGPPIGRRSNELVEQTLNEYFQGKKWRFHRVSEPRKLKDVKVSKVVDKLNNESNIFYK